MKLTDTMPLALAALYFFLSSLAHAQCANCSGNPWTDSAYNGHFYLDTHVNTVTGSAQYDSTPQCNGVTYSSVSGSYDTNTAEFNLTASSPNQASYSYYGQYGIVYCTYASQIYLQGSMNIQGCDTADGSWSNSLGFSGYWHWSKACDVPDGYPPGQGPTESSLFKWWSSWPNYGATSNFEIIVNADRDFGGRTIYENAGGNPNDGCWWPQSQVPQVSPIMGGVWYLDGTWGYNQTGLDSIAQSDGAIHYYQRARPANGLSMPCQADMPVLMKIKCNASNDQPYKFDWLSTAIDVTQVSNTRDGAWSGWLGYTP